MALSPGQSISRYQLVEQVGEGGMGIVWKALDTELNRHVAVKILPAELVKDEERRLRFKREAQAAAALDHPNIAVIHEVGEHDGIPFIAMQFLEGKNLRERIGHRALPLKDWLELALPIVEGLAHAHRHGIVHRDLKPENAIITDEGQVKLLDFGLAKLIHPDALPAGSDQELDTRLETISRELTRAGKVVGTVAYMSPEQARGEAVDHRSDLFSIGVMLYEMASGSLPFKRKSDVESLSATIAAEPRALSELVAEIPVEAELVIRKALEKQPERRYQHADELVTDLRNLKRDLDSGRTSIPSGGAPRVAAGAASKRSRVAPVVATLVLIVVAAGYGIYRLTRQEATPTGSGAIDSVAVLPFVNASDDPDAEYLSDGITESVINSLSKVSDLRVVPRSLVFAYKDRETDPQTIGKELDVRAVVTGRVAQRGDTLIVGAELMDVASVSQLWGEQYNRTKTDIFEIQEEITREIARNLQLRLTVEQQRKMTRRYTDEPEAYDAYLRGQAMLQYFSEEEVGAAREHFERALRIDPDYALAHSGLASVEAHWYRNVEANEARLEQGAQHARRALALDPELPRAHFAMGEILAVRYDYSGAAEKFREAIRLEPGNPYYHDLLSWALAYETPPDAVGAEEAAREAIALDPRFGAAYYHLGRALIHQQRYEEAIEAFNRTIDLDRDPRIGILGLCQVYLAMGDYVRAQAEMERVEGDLTPNIKITSAAIHVGLGDTEKALALLEEALSGGYRDLAFLESTPLFEPLRSDRRFEDLLLGAGSTQ